MKTSDIKVGDFIINPLVVRNAVYETVTGISSSYNSSTNQNTETITTASETIVRIFGTTNRSTITPGGVSYWVAGQTA